jgi:hypothetical protein
VKAALRKSGAYLRRVTQRNGDCPR